MVKATRKPLEQIFEMVKGYRRVLVVGCGGCTSVCLAGGQRESIALADELTTCARAAQVPQQYDSFTVERQCNPEFLEGLEDRADNVDCFLSMACGAGAGLLADAFPAVPLYPALDTMFVGVDRDVGYYEERCRSCGTCMLGDTGGICPVTRCSKGVLNGPCGGTREDGSCELAGGIHCAWHDIHERLKEQGRLSQLLIVRPPMEWVDRGPRVLVQKGYEGRYPAATREAGRR
ncbi:MAG: methylenetetrahydrofolate reductase C-terminal domain-containing protein [Spirochaetia bacterium]|jgi:ferredoxin